MNDGLLKPFLDATPESQAESLQKLYESHLQPLVRPILWSILKKQGVPHEITEEVNETEADVIAVLFPRIQKANSHPIANLSGYTARVAYHCAYQCLGKKFPLRSAAQTSLKLILRNTHGFALWNEGSPPPLCGFRVWQEKGKGTRQSERLSRALNDPAAFSLQVFPDDAPHQLPPALLLKHLFDGIGHPILFSDAVTLFLKLRGVIDEQSLSLEAVVERGFEPVALGADPMQLLQTQAGLHHIWQLICSLSPKQRASLLLDWKEIRESPVQLFLLQGALPLTTIAAALELTPRQLSEMLMSLPWEDGQIAERLDTTEKVIRNLRCSASKKLREQLCVAL